MTKMKKSEAGISLRKGQYKRLGRIAERNPERADKVAERMKKRDSRLQRGKEIANPRRMEMMKNALMKEKELKERELNAPAKKAQNGKKTAFGMLSVKKGIDNNPNPTFADKIAGAKKMAKSGSTVSMQLGSYKDIIGKNYKGKNTKAVGLTKAMNGKKMKGGGKCKNGC
jgi:hypothetical protein